MEGKNIEKKAFDKEKFVSLLKKYGKPSIAAGVLAAGLGAVASNAKKKQERKDATDLDKHKDAITIHINKDSFLDGLPTPEEFANSQVASAVTGGTKVASSGKINFFKKCASDKSDGAKDKPDGEQKTESTKSDKVVLRDASGKFVSPTDPIGVAGEEKTAGYDVWDNLVNAFAHPKNTLEGMWDAASTRPLATTAGAVASIYVASKLIEAVRKVHESKAEKKLEAARDKYITLIEGGEKTAQAKPGYTDKDNILALLAGIGGHAFVIPAALSALVVNRIIQQRKEEKKKEKADTDSYPNEPYIIYKTSEDKEMRITPETALAAFVVKRAMFEQLEAMPVEKSAVFSPSYDEAVNRALDLMYDPNNNENLLNIVKAHVSGGDPMAAFSSMSGLGFNDLMKYGLLFGTDEFKRRLMTNKKFHDLIISRFNSEMFKDSFGKYRDQLISDEVGRTFRKGSILHKLVTQYSRGKFNDQLQQAMPKPEQQAQK